MAEFPAEAVLSLPAALPDTDAMALDEALATLEGLGVNQYDPPRYAYICALVERCQLAEGPLADWYDQRARQALVDYADSAEAARAAWVQDAQALYDNTPALALAINTALENWDGRALRRLQRGQSACIAAGPLAELVTQIEALHRESPLDDGGDSLEVQLRRQERQLMAEFGQVGESGELRSARSYRQRMQRSGAERLLADSVAGAPEESGPLNPQKLATRALTNMQQLSAPASARFVAWLNALLYLEKLSPP
ncbi:DUF2894 domain-containing protein [Parahaliea aestuarii]|uniref:DUF2894 domain-containing protein n=1 Tax=Parahaliea aestuarii TaxID=1852021 RepID=A0A5C8ZV03_9GAMM|nr:DUF2894 domain-containing protein [Parahaliea aestuarii]TXS91101.1 DUF2894 domain-containing protein [Parahaliea aestuarii]